jgi:hypothetical protein
MAQVYPNMGHTLAQAEINLINRRAFAQKPGSAPGRRCPVAARGGRWVPKT